MRTVCGHETLAGTEGGLEVGLAPAGAWRDRVA